MELSLLDILPRLFISMAIVIVVMYVAARLLKNRDVSISGTTGLAIGAKAPAKKKKQPLVEVLGRQGVGKGASVSIVRTGNKTLVLGITESQVSVLTELDDAVDIELDDESVDEAPTASVPHLLSVPTMAPVASGEAIKHILETVRERTVRRSS